MRLPGSSRTSPPHRSTSPCSWSSCASAPDPDTCCIQPVTNQISILFSTNQRFAIIFSTNQSEISNVILNQSEESIYLNSPGSLVQCYQSHLKLLIVMTKMIDEQFLTLSLASSGLMLISSRITVSTAELFSPSLALSMDSLSLYTTSWWGTAFSAI